MNRREALARLGVSSMVAAMGCGGSTTSPDTTTTTSSCGNGGAVKTTKIAFPEEVSSTVYQTVVYASHGQNTTRNATDNVFSDGTQYEMATLTGNAASGFTATLTIGIAG